MLKQDNTHNYRFESCPDYKHHYWRIDSSTTVAIMIEAVPR